MQGDSLLNQVAIDSALVFSVPLVEGAITKRSRTRLQPSSSSSVYTPTGQRSIKFDIPSQNMIDFKNAALRFDATIIKAVDTQVDNYFANNIGSLFERITVRLLNGSTIEEVQLQAHLNAFQHSLVSQDYAASQIGGIEGQASVAVRTAYANIAGTGVPNTSFSYSWAPPIGLFSMDNFWPSFLYGVVQVEFFLNTSLLAVVSPTAQATFSVENVELLFDSITTTEGYKNRLISHVKAEGLQLRIPTFVGQNHPLTVQSGEQRVPLSSHTQLSTVFFGIVQNSDLSGAGAVGVDSVNTYHDNSLSSYSFSLGGSLFPTWPVFTTRSRFSEAFLSTIGVRGLWKQFEGGSSLKYINDDGTISTQRIYAIDLSNSILDTAPELLSDLQMDLVLRFDTQPSEASTLFVFFRKSVSLILPPGHVMGMEPTIIRHN